MHSGLNTHNKARLSHNQAGWSLGFLFLVLGLTPHRPLQLALLTNSHPVRLLHHTVSHRHDVLRKITGGLGFLCALSEVPPCATL